MAYKTIELTLKNAEEKDVSVLISTFPARQGIQIQAQLASILTSSGVALFSMFGSSDEEKVSKETIKQLETLDIATTGEVDKEKSSLLSRSMDFSKVDIEAVARLLVNNLDKRKVTDLLIEICSSVVIDGKQLAKGNNIFDETFSGEYGLLFEVISEVLKVNFGSFFSKGSIGKILFALRAKIPTLPK